MTKNASMRRKKNYKNFTYIYENYLSSTFIFLPRLKFLQPKVKFTLGIEFGFYKCRYALEFLFALITKCSVNIKFKHFLKANPCGFLGVLYRKLVLTVNRRTK